MIRSNSSRRRARRPALSNFVMTRHLTQPWYCVRRIKPAPDNVDAIPMLRAQLGLLGATLCDDGDETPEWEAARLMDILTFEMSLPQKIRTLVSARVGPVEAPDAADPLAVRRFLGRVIAALAKDRIYLADTDHLTDTHLCCFVVNVVLECDSRGVGDQIFVVSEWAEPDGRVANRDRHLPRPNSWGDPAERECG